MHSIQLSPTEQLTINLQGVSIASKLCPKAVQNTALGVSMPPLPAFPYGADLLIQVSYLSWLKPEAAFSLSLQV